MVSLEQIRASNAQIKTSLPSGLVAVFAGATSGIGESSVKQFVKSTIKPRVYFLGRSTESGARIRDQLQKLNPDGQYLYISVDVSAIKAVDKICAELKNKEEAINLLFLSMGTMITGKETEEGLHYPAAVSYHARIRFIVNLLPLLRRASDLRRVVSVFTATKEGPVDTSDIQGYHVPILSARGHISSVMTLGLEAVAKTAPEVSFIHTFPGSVKTNLGKDVKTLQMTILRGVFRVIGPFMTIPFDEAGERQLFMSTSARFPPRENKPSAADGVPRASDIGIARGTDGKPSSGVYSVNFDGESVGPKVERLLARMREDGTRQKGVGAHRGRVQPHHRGCVAFWGRLIRSESSFWACKQKKQAG